MIRPIFLLLLLILPLWVGGQKNQRPKRIFDRFRTVSVSGSSATVCHSKFPCKPGEGLVELTANATDPCGEDLYYEWSVPVGKLSSQGRSVTWNLNDVALGVYTATVKVNGKECGEGEGTAKVEIVACGNCDPSPPPCPTITILTPNEPTDLKHLNFAVSTSGAERYKDPSFNWTASLGKIIKGQSSSEVEIDATGFEGKELTVEVTVGGFDPSCATTVSKRLLIKQN